MISTIDRKRIFIFVAVTYAITIALALVIYFNGGIFVSDIERSHLASIIMMVMMFAPAVGNLATRLVTREGWSNTYLRPNLRRGWRIYLAAWLLPILAIIAGGVIYYLLFPGKFDLSMPFARELGFFPVTDPWTVVTREITSYLKLAPIAMFLMLGEEFGWRAYLLPKLMPLGPHKAVLLVGAIWGVFHWPAIFMGYEYRFGYWGAPIVGPLLFVLITMIESAFYAWVTLRTGSVWPASLAHAVNNAACLLMVYFLKGEWDRLIGPSSWGIVGVLGYALLALPIFLSPRSLAPVKAPESVALSKRPSVFEKATGQARPGTVS